MQPDSLAFLTPVPADDGTLPGTFWVIRALRLAALASAADIDPQPRLIQILGSTAATNRFRLLLATMDQAWPDRLTIFRPCCSRLTHDEATLLAMLHHCAASDRPAFDRLLCDMIGADARDCLYDACTRFLVDWAA